MEDVTSEAEFGKMRERSLVRQEGRAFQVEETACAKTQGEGGPENCRPLDFTGA